MLLTNKFLRRAETSELLELLDKLNSKLAKLNEKAPELEKDPIFYEDGSFEIYEPTPDEKKEYIAIRKAQEPIDVDVYRIEAELKARKNFADRGYVDETGLTQRSPQNDFKNYIQVKRDRLAKQASATKSIEKRKRLVIEPEKPASTLEEVIQLLEVGEDRGEEAKIFLLRNIKNKLNGNTILEPDLANALNNSLNYINLEIRESVKTSLLSELIRIGIVIIPDEIKTTNKTLEHARELICKAIELRQSDNVEEALKLENEAKQIRNELRRSR